MADPFLIADRHGWKPVDEGIQGPVAGVNCAFCNRPIDTGGSPWGRRFPDGPVAHEECLLHGAALGRLKNPPPTSECWRGSSVCRYCAQAEKQGTHIMRNGIVHSPPSGRSNPSLLLLGNPPRSRYRCDCEHQSHFDRGGSHAYNANSKTTKTVVTDFGAFSACAECRSKGHCPPAAGNSALRVPNPAWWHNVGGGTLLTCKGPWCCDAVYENGTTKESVSLLCTSQAYWSLPEKVRNIEEVLRLPGVRRAAPSRQENPSLLVLGNPRPPFFRGNAHTVADLVQTTPPYRVCGICSKKATVIETWPQSGRDPSTGRPFWINDKFWCPDHDPRGLPRRGNPAPGGKLKMAWEKFHFTDFEKAKSVEIDSIPGVPENLWALGQWQDCVLEDGYRWGREGKPGYPSPWLCHNPEDNSLWIVATEPLPDVPMLRGLRVKTIAYRTHSASSKDHAVYEHKFHKPWPTPRIIRAGGYPLAALLDGGKYTVTDWIRK